MKSNYLLFLLFCCCVNPLFSQLGHRNLIIEGAASTQLLIENSDSEFLIAASPTISYFLTDKFVVGGGVQFAAIPGTGTNFGLNATTRYYFSNQANNAWFAEGNLGFITGGGLDIFTGDIGLGLDLFLSPNIALENTLAIGFQKEKDILGNTIVFQLGTGLKFFFDRMPEGSADGRNGVLQKGSLFLGMTAGNIQLLSRNNVQNNTVTLSPNIGKFLSNNWVFGVNMMLQNQSFNGANFFRLEALPYLRYYANAGEKRAIPFGEIGGGMQLTTISGDRIINQTATNPVVFAGVGFNYFLRPTVAFEVKGSYSYFRQADFFDINAISINFGFQFFLRKGA